MPYIKVSIEGGYTSNPEVFSTSFCVLVDGAPPTQTAIDAYANSCMNYLIGVSADAQALRGTMSTNMEIRRVRAYYYSVPNAPASLLGVSTVAGTTGTGTLTLPPQCSRVVTLLTATPGSSFRGRMYWPKVTTGLNTSGVDASVNQGFADAYARSLRTMAEIAPSTSAGQVAVVSLSKALVTPVTRIRVGNVIDTQRRRRDSINETFFSSTV